MNGGTLTCIRLTKETKALLNISLEKTMAILASEHFAIYGNLEDIKILETDAIINTTLTKIAPFLIFKDTIITTFSAFQQFYINLLYEFCQITEVNNKDLIYMLVVKVAQKTWPSLIEKVDLCLKTKWTFCFSGYTTDPETVFLHALRCVLEHPDNPVKATELASHTRIYDVKKITVDMCMAIHGLDWILSDSVESFIKQHCDSYSIYY